MNPTRRAWNKAVGMAAAGAAAGTIESCSSPPVRTQAWAPVSIYRAATYSEELYDLVRRIIAEHALDVRGKRVVLKPNLVEFDAHTVINTNPKLVHAALEAFRAAGAADVRIAEGPGHRRVTLDLADAGGYFATVPNFESLFTDLNLDDTTKVKYCRHYAAGLYFRRWSDRWYLEINPTYHFTIDGRRDSLYDSEYVKKIKGMERNGAVYQLVRAWADYLQGEDTLFANRDERIIFGDLLTLDADAAIDERAWIPPPEPMPLDSHAGTLVTGLWEVTT